MDDKHDSGLGDMNPEEFRKWGYELVDWVADYLKDTDRYPVLSTVRPGEVRRRLEGSPPETGEPMEVIFQDFKEKIVPGITHWNHPAFFSYFSITGSAPGILGELLCSALNVNAMLWKTSPAATELEQQVLEWLRQMIGLSDEFWGIIYDTASISSLHALAAAREAVPGLEAREQGLAVSSRRLRVYASEQAHSSIEKAAITIGVGHQSVRKIPVDDQFRMKPSALESAIQEDRDLGWLPFCVVATVGTTSTTSVDPVPQIAEVSRRYGLWLHVDAAYAGPAALLPEMNWVLEGCNQADSLVTNPHKWLFTPIDLSAFYCRHPQILKAAFSLVPEYLRTTVDESVTNYMDYGVQLGRRFRALKLWMIIRYFGRKGLEDRIRQHIGWARDFAAWIDHHPELERMAPTPFSTICFRAIPEGVDPADQDALDRFNAALLERVNATGAAFLSHTKLNGRFTIRLAIGNLKTRRQHLERVKEVLNESLRALK